MGLFRSRAKKNREKAAAEFPSQQTETVNAQSVTAKREVTGETRPDPDRPGWGRDLGQQIGKARESRPSPD